MSRRTSVSAALQWLAKRWMGLMVSLLVIVSVGAAAGAYSQLYLPDRQTNPAVSKDVLDAASQGAVSTLSYGVETFDEDLAEAKAHLTGEFLTYYSQFAEKFVAPAVKQQRIRTKASVVKAAVAELYPERATVLVFVNQQTTSSVHPDPVAAASSIVVTLNKEQDAWLISEFNPI